MEKKATVFDKLMSDLMEDVGCVEMLEDSMQLKADRLERIPLRIRLIALGFIEKQTLEELNSELKRNNCAQLYSRSLWEASLIYAFLHGKSYAEWKKLWVICHSFQARQSIIDSFFLGPKINVQSIIHYLELMSSQETESLLTQHLTQIVERELLETQEEEEDFTRFLESNARAFTVVREKARYYFCKYLYFMLNTFVQEYCSILDASLVGEDYLEERLSVFKSITQLKRKKHTSIEAREILLNADISPGGIFDMFNNFYFDYVSNDWLSVLLDEYGNIASIPEEERKLLAMHLRNYEPGKYGALSDDEAIFELQKEEEEKERKLDEIYSENRRGCQHQRDRVGEYTVRKYIKGQLDIDRTTLICFLLFFGSNSNLSEYDRITEERLTNILLECGFYGLREEDDFDYFVIQFLKSKNPIDLLMEEVTGYAHREENFYLFRVYRNSHRNYDAFVI